VLRGFKKIRSDERRPTWAAFAMLFGLVGSHTVLETARDALFLARIPATRLPFVYVAIAVVTLVATELLRRFGGGLNRRAALTVFTALASAITAIFWVIVGPRYVASLYALYTWSGLVTTLVLIHFWTLLGEMFSITQAKRVFGVIGAGSVLGAIVGSAAAGALSQLIDARDLLFVAAAGLAATAAVPLWLEDVRGAPAGPRAGEQSLAQNARFIARSPYARRIVALTTLGAVAVTIGDYLFKSAAAASVPAAELAGFFATVYLILNVLSLVVQLALASAIIRWLNVSTAIAMLPLLLTGGGLAMLAAAGLPAALMIKGAEGSLKHSLHRTASELLFVPLSSLARASVKTFNEVIGQRGGQGLASIVILALVGLGAPPRAVAAALVAVSVIWLLAAITTRRHYVGLFRGRVAAGQVTYLEHFPDLDVASLEDLVASLDSQNDAQVIAAMAALDAENKARLVPSLILYHPSPEVVIEALSLFSRTRRASAAKVIDRIIDHPDLDIRIAAVTARSVIELDERGLRMRLSTEDSPEVRAAITVNLIASSAISGSDAAESLRQLLAHGTVRTRRALADAIGLRRAAGFEETLTELAGAPETEVQLAAIRAMTEVGGASMTRALIGLLDSEVLRPAVRESLKLPPTAPQGPQFSAPTPVSRPEPEPARPPAISRSAPPAPEPRGAARSAPPIPPPKLGPPPRSVAPSPSPAPVSAGPPATAAPTPAAPSHPAIPTMPRPPMIKGTPTRRPNLSAIQGGASGPSPSASPRPARSSRPDVYDEPTRPRSSAALEAALSRANSATADAAGAAARSAGLDPDGPEMAALLELSRDVIERVVWEVVPDLAEAIIRENLDKLTAKAR
jgi:ATP/ADP translocase